MNQAAAYRTLAEVPEDSVSPENYRLLKLAFQAGPSKVLALWATGRDVDTFAVLERLQFDWLPCP